MNKEMKERMLLRSYEKGARDKIIEIQNMICDVECMSKRDKAFLLLKLEIMKDGNAIRKN